MVDSFGFTKYQKFQCPGVTYKAPNITNPGSFVYFISDPPHLIKFSGKWNTQFSDMYACNCALFAYTYASCRIKERKLSGIF